MSTIRRTNRHINTNFYESISGIAAEICLKLADQNGWTLTYDDILAVQQAFFTNDELEEEFETMGAQDFVRMLTELAELVLDDRKATRTTEQVSRPSDNERTVPFGKRRFPIGGGDSRSHSSRHRRHD